MRPFFFSDSNAQWFYPLGVPSAPGQVVATRETDSSVVIQWAPPKVPNNLIGYYIDSCVKGTKDWTSANHKPNKKTKYVCAVYLFVFVYSFFLFCPFIKNLNLNSLTVECVLLSSVGHHYFYGTLQWWSWPCLLIEETVKKLFEF